MQMQMMDRRRLPNRRESVTFNFVCGNFHYVAPVWFFDDGRLAEIFIGNGKAGSGTDTAAKVRHALLRDARGAAASPPGCALDLLSRNAGHE